MSVARRSQWLASLAAVAFAGIALVSGTDRYTEHMPTAVRLVPDVMQVSAARALAAAALTEGNFSKARTHAAIAVLRDPLDLRGAAFLGAALQLSGRQADAGKAFTVAASLGWREPMTQAYWFVRNWERGDSDAAAMRLDALLRAHPDFGPAQGYLSLMESTPAGRRSLTQRLRSDTLWATAYLSAAEVDDALLRSRARFISAEAEEGLQIGCSGILPMVRELANRNYRGDADTLLGAQCPAQLDQSRIADAEFGDVGGDNPTGIGWRRHGSGDTRITPVGDGERGVELENRSRVTRLLLSQPVALPAGDYVITGSFAGEGGGRLFASLDCGASARPDTSQRLDNSAGQVLSATDCPNQILGLWLRPGERTVTLASVAITPLRR